MKNKKLEILIYKIQEHTNKTKKGNLAAVSKEIISTLKEIVNLKNLLEEVKRKKGTVLLVIQNDDNKKYIEKKYKEGKNIIIITEKWVGGLLSNWDQYQKYFTSQETKKKGKLLQIFYKKEKPSLVVLMSTKKEDLLVKECKKGNIPLVKIIEKKVSHNTDENNIYWVRTNKNIKTQYIINNFVSKALVKDEKI